MIRLRAFLLLGLLLLSSLTSVRAGEITVFAAASLKTALEDIAARWQESGGATVRFSFAGSSALARQIEQGAPADLFLSANVTWMDHLEAQGLLMPGSRRDLLRNQLVLIGPAGASVQPLDHTLRTRLGDGHLAMALVQAVPAGIYGQQALDALGLWQDLAPQVAQADNVRAALSLVALGEAPLGIVYSTDARADPRVALLATFPEDSHDPITYPLARIADSATEGAAAFYDFLIGPVAMEVFLRHGFDQSAP